MTNLSDERVVHKNVETVLVLNDVKLLNDTDVINPTLVIHGDVPNIDYKKINYIYISDFDRFYYITNIESISNNMLRIFARVDVLMSFWEQIKDNDCIVRRQENKWNLYIDDGSFKSYQNEQKIVRKFPSGFNVNNSSYILSVVG